MTIGFSLQICELEVDLGPPWVEVLRSHKCLGDRLVGLVFLQFKVWPVVKDAHVDLLLSVLREPLDPFAILPQSKFGFWCILRNGVNAETMLLAQHPVALVFTAVLPAVNSVAMLLVVGVLPEILPAVIPTVQTEALHIVVRPLAFINSAVKPAVNSDSRNLIFVPLAGIPRTVGPLIGADSVFPAEAVSALVEGAISPGLLT